MTMRNAFWILEKKDTRRLLLDSLARTRFAAYVAGAKSCDTTVEDMKRNDWRAIKVELDYYSHARAREFQYR